MLSLFHLLRTFLELSDPIELALFLLMRSWQARQTRRATLGPAHTGSSGRPQHPSRGRATYTSLLA